MIGLRTSQELGSIALSVLYNDIHRPLTNGRCNRQRIEEEITIGILSGDLQPMSQRDVNFVCDLIDDMIKDYGSNPNGKESSN